MFKKDLIEVFNVLGALAVEQNKVAEFMVWLLINGQTSSDQYTMNIIQECIQDSELILSAEAIVVLQKYNMSIVAASATVEEL